MSNSHCNDNDKKKNIHEKIVKTNMRSPRFELVVNREKFGYFRQLLCVLIYSMNKLIKIKILSQTVKYV